MTVALAFAVAVMALVQTTSIALLPALPDAFGADLATVSWVTTSTLVVGAAVNPAVGRMGDMYGKRTLLLACLGAAVVGSVLGVVADSLLAVIVARAVQGLGSGVIPLSYGLIRDELAPERLPRAVSVITAAGAGLGAGLGPVTMGAAVSAHGWRSAFWAATGLCALAFALVAAVTRRSTTRFPAPFDALGAVVLAAALAALLLGITKGSAWGWTSSPVLASVTGAGALAVWWVRWERGRDDPLVDLAVSASGPVLLAHLAGLMVGFATFAQYITAFTIVSLPAETGHGLGRSIAAAGLVQLPGAAILGAAVLLGTRVSATRGSRSLLRGGSLLIVTGFALLAARHGSIGEVVVGVTVVNAGLGAAFCALPIAIMEHVEHSQTAAVNALNALARVVGSVLASAVVTAVMASGVVEIGGVERPAAWTFVAACLIGALPAAAVGALAWRSGPLPSIHHEVIVGATSFRGGPP